MRPYLTMLVLCFCLKNSLQAQLNELNTYQKTDWHADLDFITTELPQKHYNWYATKNKDYFLKGIQQIKSSTEQLSDFEISIQLQQLIASMGDSHTNVNFSKFINKNKILPLHLFWV